MTKNGNSLSPQPDDTNDPAKQSGINNSGQQQDAGPDGAKKVAVPGSQPAVSHSPIHGQTGNVAENHSDSEAGRQEEFLDLAFQNYAAQLTSDPRMAKAAGRFGALGGCRFMHRAIEVLQEGYESPKDEIIGGAIDAIKSWTEDEADEILQEYLSEVQRPPQQSEPGSGPIS